ncbi:glucosyl-3-phosphoglycerate synthase [Candidatus Haliotispira prima]|uniref:Glucosyl-3-phosphoglycerate synthase n=1 Tax=Candidatus Haliotispira prima TaxID=3034016 RepID=A0ABY8MIS1_9SPIO|nr:glucosyl-3-phosphoglycerate synthase [Candidatus Haliotispira prima]
MDEEFVANNSDKSEKWLEENTYHHSVFQDIERLVRIKEEKGLTISLCIPTLNEEKTIGKEVVIFVSELMKRYPLIDEFAIIDSGSEDRTLEVAGSFGAGTYLADDILPHLERKKGKGENLWKAIYQLKGDIIVYVDADIENIHPRFVYGLVGPLIEREEVKYVKAFYDRPITYSGGTRTSGGGRVTEILIRPLFSLFFPELSAMIQPLSGEYAVRREVLENIPFPIGYGVETAHLLDVLHMHGIEAFAQTDLDQRVHRNQPIAALSRMSFGILQTFFSRLQRFNILETKDELLTVFRRVQVSEQQFQMITRTILEDERPPIVDIPEYVKKFPRRNL